MKMVDRMLVHRYLLNKYNTIPFNVPACANRTHTHSDMLVMVCITNCTYRYAYIIESIYICIHYKIKLCIKIVLLPQSIVPPKIENFHLARRCYLFHIRFGPKGDSIIRERERALQMVLPTTESNIVQRPLARQPAIQSNGNFSVRTLRIMLMTRTNILNTGGVRERQANQWPILCNAMQCVRRICTHVITILFI